MTTSTAATCSITTCGYTTNRRAVRPCSIHTLVDKLLDTVVPMGVRPVIELGQTSIRLAADSSLGGASPPKNLDYWIDMIRGLMHHLIDRYGKRRVSEWQFAIWNSPDSKRYWAGTRESFYELFCRTFYAVKSFDRNIQVGCSGVSLASCYNGWLEGFVSYMRREDVMLDFLGWNVTQVVLADGVRREETINLWPTTMKELCKCGKFALGDENAPVRCVAAIRQEMDRLGLNALPVQVSRFNTTLFPDDLLHDILKARVVRVNGHLLRHEADGRVIDAIDPLDRLLHFGSAVGTIEISQFKLLFHVPDSLYRFILKKFIPQRAPSPGRESCAHARRPANKIRFCPRGGT